jgi:hypothetical protein
MVARDGAPIRVSRVEVLRYRARVSGLGAKLPAGSYAPAAWGGLQDTIPRAAVTALHARVEETTADAWEDPALVQVWFRAADYVVPRADVGVFTLGAYPRDAEKARRLERWADAVLRATDGQPTRVREAVARLDEGQGPGRIDLRWTSITGRVHIRWDAADIWVIPAERPGLDVEDARRELARRLLHWYGPVPPERLGWWTGVDPADARETWRSLEPELAAVEIDGVEGRRFVLAADRDELRASTTIQGVRLLPRDDPWSRFDHELLVPDPSRRRRVLPRPSESPGYAPNPLLVDGEIAGAWQRQARRVTLHPYRRLPASARAAAEAEALAMPIAGPRAASVTWDEGWVT